MVNILSKGTGSQLWKPNKYIKWETGKKLKTIRAELPLTTETDAVGLRLEKTCPKKKPEGKKCWQEIWVGTKAQAQSLSYGTLQCNRE